VFPLDYSHILNKNHKIHKTINSINRKFDTEKYWINYNFEDNSPTNTHTFAGGDGSFNKINYVDFCLYSVGTVSYINKVGEKIEKSVSYWDTDIIIPYIYISNRLTLYMLNMELKSALWNFKNKDIDYYLLDGSLYSLIIKTHTYMGREEGSNEILYYYKKYGKEIRNKINEELDNGILAPTVSIDVKESEEDRIYHKIILEQIEYIVLLIEILKKYRDKIVGISKTSKMNIYFKEGYIPDMAIFSRVKTLGYSKPLNLADWKMVEINQGVYNNIKYLKKFGQDIDELYYQFVKLDRGEGVLNITSFKNLESEFFSNLNEISVGNYPYILKKSHEEVKIKDNDMTHCAKLLGLYSSRDRELFI